MQKELTANVKCYYEEHGPSGQGDRNTAMLGNGEENLTIQQLSELPESVAKKIIIHHHFGISAPTSVPIPTSIPTADIDKYLYQLECNQATMLISMLKGITPDSHVIDAGCGRGGTSFMLHDLLNCYVHGVTVSEYQCNYANALAKSSNRTKVNFSVTNMLELEEFHFHFHSDLLINSAIIQNETDMYIDDLMRMFRVFRNILPINGEYVGATWIKNGSDSTESKAIDQHYCCKMHNLEQLQSGLGSNGFRYDILDITEKAIDYWKCRQYWHRKSGVESHFLNGYLNGTIKYVVIYALAV